MSSEAPHPVAEGSLARSPLAHVLVHVGLRAFDGTLALWPDDPQACRGQDRILFEAGVAVRMRPLTPVADLNRGLGALFDRERAPYALYEGDLVGRGPRVVEGREDPLPLVARALRGPAARIHAGAMQRVLDRIGTAPVRVRDSQVAARLGLEEDERAVVERLAQPVSPSELLAQWADPALPRRVLYLFALTRALVVASPDRATSEPARPSGPGPSMPSMPSMPSIPTSAATQPPSGGSQPTTGSPRTSGTPPPPPTPPAPPPHLDADLSARWSAIVARAEAIEGQTYFDMLGVHPSDDAGAVRDAYFEQVRQWHPDRMAPELQPLVPWVKRIFHHVTVAHDTLSDPARRERYLEVMKEGGGTPEDDRRLEAIVGAAMELQKVEVLSRRRSWDEALEVLQGALTMNPDDPDAHAMRAWLLFQKHGTGEGAPVSDMMANADHALHLHDGCVRAHYVKGLLLKQLGAPSEALQHFRRVTELDPRHIEAAREVRLAEMRARNGPSGPPEAGRPSLLGKLLDATKKK